MKNASPDSAQKVFAKATATRATLYAIKGKAVVAKSL